MKNLNAVLHTIADNLEALRGSRSKIDWSITIEDKIEGTVLDEYFDNTGLVELKMDSNLNIEANFHIYKNAFKYDENEDIEDSFKFRFIDFLNGINVPWCEESHMILLFLHEVGHVQSWKTSVAFDITHEFKMLNEIHINSLSLAFKNKDRIDLREEGLNVATYFSSDECQADIYAITHFYPIWNMLKERGLI